MKENPTVGYLFFGLFLSDCIPKGKRMSTYISSFTVYLQVCTHNRQCLSSQKFL